MRCHQVQLIKNENVICDGFLDANFSYLRHTIISNFPSSFGERYKWEKPTWADATHDRAVFRYVGIDATVGRWPATPAVPGVRCRTRSWAKNTNKIHTQLKPTKSDCSRREIHLILSEILSQMWYHCGQYTTCHNLSRISLNYYRFRRSWLIRSCYLFLSWPALQAVQASSRINSTLRLANFGTTHASNVRWGSYDTT